MSRLSVLDTAGTFAQDRDDLRRRSAPGRMGTLQVQAYGPGGEPRRTWTLTWPIATRATSQLVRHHWEANARRTFDLTVPGTGVVHVAYLAGPRIQRTTHRNYQISLSVREAFARST